mmetsp:Transcript_107032/g.345346  ORF Transcript_107032/g.345346 Transcript_107032/m.345346 type:complete len:252 (+) Transcript_107032:102-857(+)
MPSGDALGRLLRRGQLHQGPGVPDAAGVRQGLGPLHGQSQVREHFVQRLLVDLGAGQAHDVEAVRRRVAVALVAHGEGLLATAAAAAAAAGWERHHGRRSALLGRGHGHRAPGGRGHGHRGHGQRPQGRGVLPGERGDGRLRLLHRAQLHHGRGVAHAPGVGDDLGTHDREAQASEQLVQRSLVRWGARKAVEVKVVRGHHAVPRKLHPQHATAGLLRRAGAAVERLEPRVVHRREDLAVQGLDGRGRLLH